MRTLIVDDHNLVRAGFRRMLDGMTPLVEVVGETGNGREALRMIGELDVELVITDLSMPDLGGVELIRKAMKRNPDLKCVVLSMHTAREHVGAALRAGACGYLHKNASDDELTVALQTVARGATYLHPAVAGSVVEMLREIEESIDPLDQLTDRQRETLKLVAEGYSTKEIAERMHVSAKTVETHRAQLMERLDIRNVPGLVKFAVRRGLVDLESD